MDPMRLLFLNLILLNTEAFIECLLDNLHDWEDARYYEYEVPVGLLRRHHV